MRLGGVTRNRPNVWKETIIGKADKSVLICHMLPHERIKGRHPLHGSFSIQIQRHERLT